MIPGSLRRVKGILKDLHEHKAVGLYGTLVFGAGDGTNIWDRFPYQGRCRLTSQDGFDGRVIRCHILFSKLHLSLNE
jgi:hypothetical protein